MQLTKIGQQLYDSLRNHKMVVYNDGFIYFSFGPTAIVALDPVEYALTLSYNQGSVQEFVFSPKQVKKMLKMKNYQVAIVLEEILNKMIKSSL